VRIEGAGALIAGGASGLGAATARRLDAAGARVVIADVDIERGEALAAELGGDARFVRTDVREPGEVEAAVAAAAANEGGLRVAVSCAGVGPAERIAGRRGPHALDAFERVIAINLIGTFNVLRLAASAMLANEPEPGDGRGVCITTASIAAFDGQVGQVAYAASKAGVVGLTLPAARDLAERRVRVMTIAPGLFDTPLLATVSDDLRAALAAGIPHPRRLGSPGEYAALVVHCVENPMLNGECIRLDGALRMPPGGVAS
jgi:3-hydroxyacyl-CoA dehydrogenase / 3-hydroxy-2-methylbutyryl-CoA dehydrogenase